MSIETTVAQLVPEILSHCERVPHPHTYLFELSLEEVGVSEDEVARRLEAELRLARPRSYVQVAVVEASTFAATVANGIGS